MLGVLSPLKDIGGNGAKAYQCAFCTLLITYSDRLIRVDGKDRHLFVNPAGLECDFYTFAFCPGSIPYGEATEVHTWFPGYQWRMAFCRQCGQHLGWYYQALSISSQPRHFWGILVIHLRSV
ncbi:MAG: hypothetical protein JSU72_17495 [Deltaproteobacteria bacterium]|nr:MAG: hypothetical protein JSU72_17495 [Deltaproteobacteria bacterium]